MKSAFRGLDTFQVAGFLLSAGVSIGLLLIGQDTLSSIILGFVLATLTQLFDVQKRIGEVEERVLNSTKLGQQLYKNDWLYSYIEEIVKDYNTVENSWFEIFTEGAKDRIVVCRNQLHSLAEGYIVGGLGDRFSPVASGYYKRAKKSLKATSINSLDYWKRRGHSIAFLDGNAQLIKRGVKITRIFIDNFERMDDLVDVCKAQAAIGVDIYIANSQEIPRELNEDFLLIDDNIFTKVEKTGDGRSRAERTSTNHIEISEKNRNFDMLLQYSEKLEDFLRRVKA